MPLSTKSNNWYCTCGAAVKTGDTRMDRLLLDAVQSEHRGPGHAECDAKTAAAARQKDEAKRRGR